MFKPWTWGVASNDVAISNAREASTVCSRLRVERADVELFLAGVWNTTGPDAGLDTGPGARAVGEH